MTDTPKKRIPLTAEDISLFCYFRDDDLPEDKRAQMREDLKDPNSFVKRFLQEIEDEKQRARRMDRSRPKRERPATESYERQAIVNFIRKSAQSGTLSQSQAEEILAEAGETISWIDSPADRELMEGTLVAFEGDPAFKRFLLINMSPVLADVVADGNRMMVQKLAEFNSELSSELRAALEQVRTQASEELANMKGKKGRGRNE